jgi:hypothetical protein
MAPVPEVDVPSGQDTHSELPELGWISPIGQSVHVMLPCTLE